VSATSHSPKQADAAFREPEPIDVALADANVVIRFGWSLQGASLHRPELALRQRSGFLIRFKCATPLKAALDYVYELRNFVGLGVGQLVALTKSC
jgi:hypothetical protein